MFRRKQRVSVTDVLETVVGEPLVEADESWGDFLSVRAGMLQFMHRIMGFWGLVMLLVVWNLCRQLLFGVPPVAAVAVGAAVMAVFAWYLIRIWLLLGRVVKASAREADDEHRTKLARNEELRRKLAEGWAEVTADELATIDDLRRMSAETKEGE